MKTAPRLKPFFCFYGAKYRIAPRYPAPRFDRIVEPFAGAAGYSMRYPDREVQLNDRDPVLVELWRYLILASRKDILSLPDIRSGETVDQHKQLCPAERSLIGFWLNKGTVSPSRSPSSWMRSGIRGCSFWGPEIRSRVSSQLDHIRHWKVRLGSYAGLKDRKATWFVDPPYQHAGRFYKCGAAEIDFADLGEWCQSRRGQVIVCENEGADWLPFRPFMDAKSTLSRTGGRKNREVIWTKSPAR